MMSTLRFFAIVIIFTVVSIAWMTLAGTVWYRTNTLDEKISPEIKNQWGPFVVAQAAPYWSDQKNRNAVAANIVVPSSSKIVAKIVDENRNKGLLWYSMFTVQFKAEYTFDAAAPSDTNQQGNFIFDIPEGTTPVDLIVLVDGREFKLSYEQKISGHLSLPMERSARHVISIEFKTKGQIMWEYCPGRILYSNTSSRNEQDDKSTMATQCDKGELNNFSLTINTNFTEIDYPRGSLSPSIKASPNNGGMAATWKVKNSISHQSMGIVMPRRDNAGPIIARMSMFAPVSLFFFFTVLFTVVILKKIPLHPMHYLFLAASFFAFHILLAYLADQMPIQAAFWLCAAVSVVLVVSYLRLVAGGKFAFFYAGAAQLVYLVGFSYAFFWVGKTGLTVTIGAIATLFVLMQATGRVNWFEVFSLRKKSSVASRDWQSIPPLPNQQPIGQVPPAAGPAGTTPPMDNSTDRPNSPKPPNGNL
ncbi:MAG: inner membrane CreD family protein [Phycisphaerae bacterium]|nr:inner membrane CreD family protein [Phycisphaerae bacterium]